MKPFKAYLFDFDGTLFDSRESLLPVWKYGFAKMGVDNVTDAMCEEFMHHNLSYAAKETGITDFSAFLKAITEALDFPENIAVMKMFPDTVAVISTLFGKGLPLGIVSSNTSSHIQKALSSKGVDRYFSALSCSDEYEKGKPDAEPCLLCLQKLSLSPSKEICYVGDSLQDYECALNAGVKGILLDRDGHYNDFSGTKIASLYELVF